MAEQRSGDEKLIEEGLLFWLCGAVGKVYRKCVGIRADGGAGAEPINVTIAKVNPAIDPGCATIDGCL